MIMDRLPLMQALTAAGLERSDCDRVEASLTRCKASIGRCGASMKADFVHGQIARRADSNAMETRLTLRLGGIAVGLLFVLLRFTGHAP